MKLLRRTLALLLLLSLLLCSLASCNYRPQKSSKKEAPAVFTLGEDTVAFEALYTFFRNRCEKIPNFDSTYFDGEEGDARFAAILAEATAEIADIYAVFAHCREVGIDPESKDVEKTLQGYLEICVKGGVIGEYYIEGAGSYKDFIDAMKKAYHMNDAVVRLMLRAAICEELLSDYYEEEYGYTESDVRAFFDSDECIRILWASREKSVPGLTNDENHQLMKSIKAKMDAGAHNEAIQLSTNQTTYFYMGRHTKDDAYYGELIDTAFTLSIGETSEILDLGSEGYFVIKRLAKLDSDFASSFYYEEIANIFVTETMYGRVDEIAASLLQSIVYTNDYHALTTGDFFEE